MELNLLALAFDKYVKADKPNKKNPFLTNDFLSLADKSAQDIESLTIVGGTSQRIQNKKKKLVSSDVLRK